MPAVNYNFIVEQGSDFVLTFQYNDQNNNPIDLTSKCVVLQIKPTNANYVYTFSSQQPVTYDSYGFSLVASDKGLITFNLSAAFTNEEFTFNTAVYDLDIIAPGGNILQNIRLATGTITVQKRNISLLTSCPVGDNPKQVITGDIGGGGTTPSVTPTPTVSPSGGGGSGFEDLCLATDCINPDVYAIIYNGSGMNLTDLSEVSGSVTITDTRAIENVELVISKLQHNNPQDLQLFLAPPSGNKILLSANHKIANYSNNFSFMFSNKALPTSYLHNVTNGNLCNIYDKTNIVKYSNETLESGFNHLFGHSLTGTWSLLVKDTDPIGSGYIDAWKLVITYS
jgi:subtilisin-like proprotein convertase family protein